MTQFSDDDETCTSEGLTPVVCALTALARPTKVTRSKFGSESDLKDLARPESAERLEHALLTEIDLALAGNHSSSAFTDERIAQLQDELAPVFATLPHEKASEASNGLGLAAARYLLHQHFLRRHSWHVRGLNPAADARKPASQAETLRTQVAGNLLRLLSKKVGKRGLSLQVLAVFVAMIEHLIHGDEQERLKAAWTVHDLQLNSTTDAKGLVSVLEVFMAHYVFVSQQAGSGYALTLANAKEEIKHLEWAYDGWREIRRFVMEAVLEQAKNGQKPPFKLAVATAAAEKVLLRFKSVSSDMCSSLKDRFMNIPNGLTGSVLLSDVRAQHDNLFRESDKYLHELGALDETDPQSPRLLIPNVILGPSNCDATTSFYDLCCPNECEVDMEHLERALAANQTTDHVSSIVEDMQRRHRVAEVSAAMKDQLKDLAQAHGGKVPIHGRSFAEWLHKMLPTECPRPRFKDFADGDAIPEEHDFQALHDLAYITALEPAHAELQEDMKKRRADAGKEDSENMIYG